MLLRQRLLAHHADPGRTQLKVPPTQPLARTWADAARLTAVYSLSVRLGLSRKAAGGRKRPLETSGATPQRRQRGRLRSIASCSCRSIESRLSLYFGSRQRADRILALHGLVDRGDGSLI